ASNGQAWQWRSSIYWQASKDRWAAVVTFEGGKRKVLYGKTRQDAGKKLSAAFRDADQGLRLPDGRLTVAQYLAEWLEESAKPKLKPSTYITYAHYVRAHILPALGKHQLAKLAPHHVHKFLNESLETGLEPRSVQQLH